MSSWKTLQAGCLAAGLCLGCAPVEYSVVIVQASKAIAEAERAGAHCTDEQLEKLSPVTRNRTQAAGRELASSDEKKRDAVEFGAPMCKAPFEYYSAWEYRQQAREEVSYSDYGAAVEFARESRDMARKASDIARNRDEERVNP